MNLAVRIYRARRIFKYVFPTLVVLAACILLSGPIAFLTLIGVSTQGLYEMLRINTTRLLDINNQTWTTNEPPTYAEIVSMIGGNVKAVMCSGLSLFLYIIGSMGLWMWSKCVTFQKKGDNKRFAMLSVLGGVFFAGATLGLMALLNYAYS